MTLVGLTRLMPKDGRSHYSHTFLSYMHKHAECLRESICKWLEDKAQGIGKRLLSPCVMVSATGHVEESPRINYLELPCLLGQ